MPIYEYRCQKCGHELEVMQKVDDPAPGTCPSCQTENTLERLMSRSSFHLKGGGWYSDLYGSAKKDSGTAKADSSTSTTSTPAASTSTATAGSGSSTASTTAPAAATPSSGSSTKS